MTVLRASQFRILGRALLGALLIGLPCGTGFAADKLEYNRDIRPILSEYCFACHGPDSASRKADFRIDLRDQALLNENLVPGKPDDSEVIRRILADDPAELMPPPHSRKELSSAQKETLRRWVTEGAEYQLHWSFLTPQRAALPAVKNTAWPRNPIDNFVLAKLEAEGLAPAPAADRRTLARRLALDLTGLPPKAAEVEAFVADQSPDAYEKYVDLLLSSPQWGEHRARYWLDAARYADTHGIHFDNYREIWAYRDWVINAFNRNLPFDQFTIEQLAGDLLPNKTLDQQVASGFNRCNITTNEGGAISEEYLVLYARDRTETVSQVWMGMTTGCAVCHDHKFDPFSQKDFYALAAFFNNTTQNAMDGNIKDTPPTIVVPQAADRERFAAVGKEVTDAANAVTARKTAGRAEFENWLTVSQPETIAALIPTEGLITSLPLMEGPGKTEITGQVAGQTRSIPVSAEVAWAPGQVGTFGWKNKPGVAAIEVADAGNFEKDQAFTAAAWVFLPASRMTGSLFARMNEGQDYRGWDLWVENNRVGMHIIHKWQEDALKVVTTNPIPNNQWVHVAVSYDGSAKAAGLQIYVNGELQGNRNIQADSLQNTILTDVPLKVGQRHTQSRVDDLQIQDIRLYDRVLAAPDMNRLARGTRAAWLALKPADQRSEPEKNELYDWWLPTVDEPYQQATARLAALQQEEATIKSRGTIAHVMNERMDVQPAAFVLFRGEYDKRRDAVPAATPEVLPKLPEGLPTNRLGLAQWLLRPEHPLTARVTVNRYWQEVFGAGLVRTAGDFGITGEQPSHPELLDWMAVEFRENNWDIKQFFKLMVTSATYRQSAVATTEKLERDLSNRLLSRGPRFRMDAEMVRDYALAASGILVPKIGGPSVKPYQPDGVWEAVAMIGSNTRDYRRDTGENLYRRSMYTFWKRSAPPASMDIFNAPARELCTVRRERTNTPLQALVTLNDVQFVEAAKFLAQRTLKEGGTDFTARANFIGLHILARPFKTQELAVLQASYNDLQTYYQGHADDAKLLLSYGEFQVDAQLNAAELAAWTMLINEVLNLDEVLNK